MKLILWVAGVAGAAILAFAVWAKTEARNADRAAAEVARLQREVTQLETAKSAAENRVGELELARQLLNISMEQRKKENDLISAQLSQARSDIRRITNELPEPERKCALDPIPYQYVRLLDPDPNHSGDGNGNDMPPGPPQRSDGPPAAPTGRGPVDGDD